jgi:hypothetical protein
MAAAAAAAVDRAPLAELCLVFTAAKEKPWAADDDGKVVDGVAALAPVTSRACRPKPENSASTTVTRAIRPHLLTTPRMPSTSGTNPRSTRLHVRSIGRADLLGIVSSLRQILV